MRRRKCEWCNKPADHADTMFGRVRAWCEQHTPWSGHFEDCGERCFELAHGMSMADDHALLVIVERTRQARRIREAVNRLTARDEARKTIGHRTYQRILAAENALTIVTDQLEDWVCGELGGVR